MGLTDEEKEALSIITACSMQSETTVKEVLLAILIYSSIKFYDSKDSSKVTIPYFGEFNLTYKENPGEKGIVSDIDISALPSVSLLKEFVAIKNGEQPPSKKYFKKVRNSKLKDFLTIKN